MPADKGDVWINFQVALARVHGSTLSFVSRFQRQKSEGAYREPSGVIWWIRARESLRFENNRFVRIAAPKVLSDAFGNRVLRVEL
jgi:hypothetical protein